MGKVNASNAAFVSGDKILFESGKVFRGQIVLIGRTGITLGTYPETGSAAFLKGSIEVSSWTEDGGHHYATLSGYSFVSNVYVDTVLQGIARTPNANAMDPESEWYYNDNGTVLAP